MIRDTIINEYFDYLYYAVGAERYSGPYAYRQLLMCLHDIEFRFSIPRDYNRADDGMELRCRFARQHNDDIFDLIMDVLDGPCSVLEMMVALAMRCEQTIMDDPDYGDRTGQWFWNMINNLGLGDMTDIRFDEKRVRTIVDIFLDREYEPNGKGGLFTIKNCPHDLRKVEIWYQLSWYLDSII